MGAYEQSKRLRAAERIYEENILTDTPTILVEGETDIDYLKIAIAEHSPLLHSLLSANRLRIVCKNDGAGCTMLSDWTMAWVYSGFKSRMLVLFDKDEAGIIAKQSIENNEMFRHRQNSVSVRIQHIEPSDEIITLLSKSINVSFEIEHLLSIDFWKEIKKKNYHESRTVEDLNKMFSGLVPRDKTLDMVIGELVEKEDIRDTILTFKPKSTKKKKIVDMLTSYGDKKLATEGLKRTIDKIESFFCN